MEATDNDNSKVFLTIHGHFYQPPRENPWLEAIEQQPSANPFHDWNERINSECYNPNSVSKIVDENNKILNVVNNYENMSFNIGPTLLSWLEENSPQTYERIIKADISSRKKYSGHGNALAQVYNHMIMPLSNERDKQTQVKWGIKDFEYRFGREPEGMWLAETAVDDDTLRVLVENGIKFTVLSPYQTQRVRQNNSNDWQDVSWGNIDPARTYRYYIKSAPGKFIDLFFYDGAISKSVAFDELLKDGNKFVNRLKDGICNTRNYPQLINIATDGESYGHHTKFGDMALSYAIKIKAPESFIITNYAEYLEKYRSDWEVELKPVSSWSCFHGVGRWCEDCGCSTGGRPNWNQKWRNPLRRAFDYLRDEMVVIFKKYGKKYFLNPEETRNNYINVILNRSDANIKAFQDEYFQQDLSKTQLVEGMKLLEIQRHAMLMYTSCGWFFSDISGIETIQIMKYAARVMQLAKTFSKKDLETHFLEILSEAQSNLPEYGSGRDIYEKFVKPSVITPKQIASLWAISSLYTDIEEENEEIYCYKIKRNSYKKIKKGNSVFVIGQIDITSNVTLEVTSIEFALLQFSGGDFHCAIKEVSDTFMEMRKELIRIYLTSPLTEIIRTVDGYFGTEYFTLKDIFIEERQKILQKMLKNKLQNLANTYDSMYNDGKGSIYQMQSLGLDIPDEFKISAQYVLTRQFNDLFADKNLFLNSEILQQAADINFEAKKIGVVIDKIPTSKIFSKKIAQNIGRLAYALDLQQADATLEILNSIANLELEIDVSEAQNSFFSKIVVNLEELIHNITCSSDRELVEILLKIGEILNINMNYYKQLFDKSPVNGKSEN